MATREQNRTRQRERILDAARSLFTERGFDEVTVSEVAAKSGVARATVFNHFRSKQALVQSITTDVLAYYDAMLQRALSDEDTPTPVLIRALFAHMGSGIENAERFYKGAFREIMRIQVGLDEPGPVREIRQQTLLHLTTLLERGRARGDLRAVLSAAELARAFDALANGSITSWLYDGGEDSLEERMTRAAEVFLHGVGVAERDAPKMPLPDFALGYSPNQPSNAGGAISQDSSPPKKRKRT